MKRRLVITSFVFILLVLSGTFFVMFSSDEVVRSTFLESSVLRGITGNVIEIIIPISNAEHLDSDKKFISNIYEEVKELDGIWSEEISNGEYVRVTFEEQLRDSNDITIYPRVVSGNPRIEVYEKNSEIKIAEFDSILSNEYNKIYLTNLISEEQDSFDLRVVNGSVKFDHIIDPTLSSVSGSYYDDFETGTLNTSWWTATGWSVSTEEAQFGTYHLYSAGASGDDAVLGVDSSGYENIDLSYYVYTYDKKGVSLAVEYYDGSSWTTLSTYTGNNNQLLGSHTLSSSADDNSNLEIRFTCTGAHTLDQCGVDNVNVSGAEISDEVYPQFTNLWESVSSGSSYSYGQSYVFNSTVSNTNGTVYFSLGGNNYSASSQGGGVYSVTLNSLPAGSFDSYWFGYGNGTLKNYNSTSTTSYIVNKATPTASLTNDKAWTRTYDGTANSIGYSESNSGDGDVSYVIYRDGVSQGSSDSVSSAGTYSYVLNTTGGENYSSSSSLDSNTLTINKATPTGSITGTASITYGTAADITGSESNTVDSDVVYKLYRDGVEVSNPDTSSLTPNTYGYIYNTTGGENYSSSSSLDTFSLVVQSAPAVRFILSGGDSRLNLGSGGRWRFANY